MRSQVWVLISSNQMTAIDKYGNGENLVKKGVLFTDDQKNNITVDGNAFFTSVSMAISI